MEFPILENGARIGTLSVTREGLYTRFEAAIPARSGLHRLWLCGETGAACLGLLEPEGGALRLSRRLSRAELKRLPAPLLHAALSEPPRPAEQPKSAEHPRSAAPPPSAPPASEDGFRRVTIGGKAFVVFTP